MTEDLRCVNAQPARRNGETIVRRCTGSIVPSSEGERFVCSVEGDEMTYRAEVMESFRAAPLWHRTFAVNKMLALLIPQNCAAFNSSYPWIQIPFDEREKAMIESSTASWVVNFYRDEHPYQSDPTDISTESEDTEAIATAIAAIVSRWAQARRDS